MAEETSGQPRLSEPGDPVMLVLTGLLRLGPMRVSRILPNQRAVGFMIPVAASLTALGGALVGAMFGWWLSRFVGGIDMIVFCAVAGGLAGYVVATAKVEGRSLFGWLLLVTGAKLRGRVELNGRHTRVVTAGVHEPPPPGSTVVAASRRTVVYAVPSRHPVPSEVYLGVARLRELRLGRMVLADSVVPAARRVGR